MHALVGFEIIRFGIGEGWSTLHGGLAAGLASIALATVVHYLIEVPGERWSRSTLTRLRAALA